MHFSWWTFLIQAANFLVLVWLLNRLLFRPVNDVIERRRQKSRQAESDAEQAQAEAEAERRRYQQALADIDRKQREAIDTAHQKIEADRAAILSEAKTRAAAEISEARKAVALEKSEAIEGTRIEIARMAVAMASRLLADTANEIPNSVSLARLEKELDALSPRERRQMERDVSESGGALEVVTARTLAAEEREIWQGALEQALRIPLKLTFKHDPELISGAVLHLPHISVRASLFDRMRVAEDAILRGAIANDS